MPSADAHRAAVLGSPIAHSLSPVLHRAAYAELGLDEWSYDRFEVDEAALPGFIEGLDRSWAGLSLTMPLKRAIIPLLDEISPTAASVEAVNTVVFTEDGRRTGDNTDIPGMIAALRERGVEKVESAAVLGAGATASSALAALAVICAGPVTAYVRSRERGDEMRGWGQRLGVDVRVADWAEGLAHWRRRSSSPRPRPVRRTPWPPTYRRTRASSSTCCTSRGRRRSPRPGRHAAALSSEGSTSSCTRRCSRSSR